MGRIDHVLSWNMGCGTNTKTELVQVAGRLKLLAELVVERSVTLLALQEAPSEGELAVALGPGFGLVRTIKGVTIGYDNLRWSIDESDTTNPRIAIAGLQSVGATESLWLVSVHGPSSLHTPDPVKRAFVRKDLGAKLLQIRGKDSGRQNIVAGDFNLPPFDEAVVMVDGLYANRSLPWVQSKAEGIDRRMFNTTWGILNQFNGACGTFHRSQNDVDGPWYAIDQIIMTAKLVDEKTYAVEVVEKIGGVCLRTSGSVGAPNVKIGSDHLPLMARASVG